jgi:hypothetical protein
MLPIPTPGPCWPPIGFVLMLLMWVGIRRVEPFPWRFQPTLQHEWIPPPNLNGGQDPATQHTQPHGCLAQSEASCVCVIWVNPPPIRTHHHSPRERDRSSSWVPDWSIPHDAPCPAGVAQLACRPTGQELGADETQWVEPPGFFMGLSMLEAQNNLMRSPIVMCHSY